MKKTYKIFLCAFTLINASGCNNSNQTSSENVDTSTSTIVDSSNIVSSDDMSSSTNLDSTSTSTSSDEQIVDIGKITNIDGIQDTTHCVNHYFNALKGVSAFTSTGYDISQYINVSGNVNYGKQGDYYLKYSIDFEGEHFEKVRKITIDNSTFIAPSKTASNSLNQKVDVGSGSYFSGKQSGITHPKSPSYLENDLLDKPIPTNGWWTSLIFDNWGGSNGIYTNPLKSSFNAKGFEVTNPGEGFVQYWNVNDAPTQAQFSVTYNDLYVSTPTLSDSYQTKVIDYSDNSVKVAMRNNNSNQDEAVVNYVQGSPYIYSEFKSESSQITVDTRGVDSYEYYDLSGNLLDGNTHTGDSLILKMVNRHIGYDCSKPANVGQAIYEDRYFLINVPKDSEFTLSNKVHAAGFNDFISVKFNNGNYMSICPLQSLQEASFYHAHAYSFMGKSNVSYDVNHQSNVVTSTFTNNIEIKDESYDNTPILALLPHQYKMSNANLSDRSIRTVRGTLKMMVGNSFETKMTFNGVLPSFTLPSNEQFSKDKVKEYLMSLDENTSEEDSEGFLSSSTPYWNAKALYPLSQGVIIAEQTNFNFYKLIFLSKIKNCLTDWFTYDSSNSKDRFLNYNDELKTIYYSDDEFGTASQISDHHFTHGYLVFAAAVVAKYDQAYYEQYKEIINLLLKDYMNTDASDTMFPYLRTFDSWAGHSWAHGYGNFAEGNNQESSGEALNSWLAGYMIALQEENTEMMDAAIVGYTTELYAIKQYWFNYDNDNWSAKFANEVSVAGMIWGGKFDYATWFGANPTFIYGIHFLPTGEYISSYSLNDTEKTKLTAIYNDYLKAVNGSVNTWYSNMWSLQAVFNSETALSLFDENKILNDDYPNELVGAYYTINALASLGDHSSEINMQITSGVSSSVYEKDGVKTAMIWNSSDSSKNVIFINNGEVYKTVEVSANSFTSVIL